MTYQITRQLRIHNIEDDWFYQLTDDGQGLVEINQYTSHGIEETKTGETFHISKDCLETFISVLQELK